MFAQCQGHHIWFFPGRKAVVKTYKRNLRIPAPPRLLPRDAISSASSQPPAQTANGIQRSPALPRRMNDPSSHSAATDPAVIPEAVPCPPPDSLPASQHPSTIPGRGRSGAKDRPTFSASFSRSTARDRAQTSRAVKPSAAARPKTTPRVPRRPLPFPARKPFI